MTIVTTVAKSGPYYATAQDTFDVQFQSASETEIEVRLDDVVLDPSSYVFTREADGTGSVVTNAPVTGRVEIYSRPDLTQNIAFNRYGAWYPDQINPGLDKAAIRDLYLDNRITELGETVLDITGVASVPTRAALAAIAPTDGQAVFVTEQGFEKLYVWRLGDFSDNILSDPGGQFYWLADGIPATTGAWVGVLRDFQQPVPLAVPSGFDWFPPVAIYRSQDGVYTTNFNASAWKIDATASIWISEAGNDGNDGSEANPYRNLWTAIPALAALPDENVTLFMVAGEYISNASMALPDKNVNVIAVGGRALITNKIPHGSWTLDGAGTYKTSLGGYNALGGVRDWKFPVTQDTGDETPQFLTLAADKAACQATPGTYWTDGVDIWVHRQDGSAVDDATGADVGVIHLTSNTSIFNADRVYYFENIDFEGNQMVCQPPSMTTVSRVVFNDSVFYFGSYAYLNTDLVIHNRCRAYESTNGDLFAFAPRGIGEPSTNAIAIDCAAIRNRTAGPNDNCSTNHGAGRTVRVNCYYRDSMGPVCADVGEVQSWNINVDAQDSLLSTNDEQDASFVVGNSVSTACKSWLDGCATGGSFYDFYVGPGCNLYYRNMALPASIGGAGSVSPY